MTGPGSSIPGFHLVPDSVNVVVGTPTGTVADVQTWQDGNTLDIVEAAATPGQDIQFAFVNVKSIRRVGVAMNYVGSATHWIEIRLYDYVAAAFKTVWTFSTGMGLNYRYSDLPIDGQNFIDAGGNALMQIYHPVAGNAAHNSNIDYVALIT